jgi:hypothetical protein
MKAWPVIGLLFGTAILAAMPISPQATPRGVELRVDRAQAQVTYQRYRRVPRRVSPRAYPAPYGPYGAYGGYGGYYGPPPIGGYGGLYPVPRYGGFHFNDFYSVF